MVNKYMKLKRNTFICITILAIIVYMLDASTYGTARIVDGDTLIINAQRIRLYGVDALEKFQKCKTEEGREWECGMAVKDQLTLLVNKSKIYCFRIDKDKYKREVSICFNHKFQDINAEMVRSGHAVAYRSYSTMYIVQEREAKEAQRGVWSGIFESPEKYRRSKKY